MQAIDDTLDALIDMHRRYLDTTRHVHQALVARQVDTLAEHVMQLENCARQITESFHRLSQNLGTTPDSLAEQLADHVDDRQKQQLQQVYADINLWQSRLSNDIQMHAKFDRELIEALSGYTRPAQSMEYGRSGRLNASGAPAGKALSRA